MASLLAVEHCLAERDVRGLSEYQRAGLACKLQFAAYGRTRDTETLAKIASLVGTSTESCKSWKAVQRDRPMEMRWALESGLLTLKEAAAIAAAFPHYDHVDEIRKTLLRKRGTCAKTIQLAAEH